MSNIQKTKLAPCPFCGGREQHEMTYNGDYQTHYLQCRCGARLSWSKTKEDAIKAWNSRPTEPKNDIDAIYLYQEEIAGYKKELETLKRRVGEAPTAIVLTSGKIPSSPLGFYKDYELMKVALVEKLEDE